ncbi:MAG: prenyltransferase [Acidimicrobiales bacterium]
MPASEPYSTSGAFADIGSARQPGSFPAPAGQATLAAVEVQSTASWIASLQLSDGLIPWYKGGHGDPWNHVEAAMALSVAGWTEEALRAFEWLRSTQHDDGSWCRYYLADGIEDPRRDPNVTAYVATGAWWHFLVTGDADFLEGMWNVIDRAITFALGMQLPGGAVAWSADPDGRIASTALLTSTSSIYHSVKAAVSVAGCLGYDRPEWELAAERMAHAILVSPQSFAAKDRWAMDWYYPVLSGALSGPTGRDRLDRRSKEFVMADVGVRCVADQPWVTAAETAECAIAFDSVGLKVRAVELLSTTRHMREEDGSYWTGCVHPECIRYPGGEKTTYTAAAVVIAEHCLSGTGPASGLFRGETFPAPYGAAEVVDSTAET